MNCLLINDLYSDFAAVLESCGVAITRLSFEEAVYADLSSYDRICIFGAGTVLDPRLRERLETEAAKPEKRFFLEALPSWGDVYGGGPADTTTRRLVAVCPEEEGGIPGLSVGDLLDDGSNGLYQPCYSVPGMKPLLVYRDRIIAHRHWNAPREEILESAAPGLWFIGDNQIASSFTLHNFNRARFAPRETWKKVIAFLVRWLSGNEPSFWPEPVVRYGVPEDLSEDSVFEKCRRETIERGIAWLRGFLVDEGRGGIREGLRHNVNSDGFQTIADDIRTDCTGESAGAFKLYGSLFGRPEDTAIGENLFGLVFGPMTVKGGLFDGMLRWTKLAWQVCYQDDAARAILPALYDCLYLGNRRHFPAICRVLDFLVRTTAKDGCRVSRTDAPKLDEEKLKALAEEEQGRHSAHYNGYYHAALLAAYLVGGNPVYLDTARRGLETIMSLYPKEELEQSETQEMCRLILPLALLYQATGEDGHLKMLHRVTDDLVKHKHPSGGYLEWDTDYRANCSRLSPTECSVLTENGDPVADLLYSTNWLPVAFATAWHVTGDERFYRLWRDVASFCINTQIRSEDPKTNGSWCRAFDLEHWEVYAAPHDVGWAAKCSETGWTDAEILMGLMLPDIFMNIEKIQ